MDLLIAILFALKVYVDPSMTKDDIRKSHPVEFDHAVKIINNNMYHVDKNGVIIIDETGGKN